MSNVMTVTESSVLSLPYNTFWLTESPTDFSSCYPHMRIRKVWIYRQARWEPVWGPGELRSLKGCLTPERSQGPSDTAGPGVAYPLNIGYRLFVFFGVFVRLRISPPTIKLAASNFARRLIGVQGRESPIFVKLASTEAQNRTNRPARGPRPFACKHYRRDVLT